MQFNAGVLLGVSETTHARNEKAGKGKRKFGAYTMKRVAAGVHLPTPWVFEPVKRPDDRVDYCLVGNAIIRMEEPIILQK